MLKDILASFLEYFKINSQSLFLKKKKIRIIVAVLYIIFFASCCIGSWWLINYGIQYINNFLNIKYGIEDITPLNSFIIINLQVSIRAMFILGVLSLSKYVLLTLCSPIVYVVIGNILNQKISFQDFKQHVQLSLYITYFHGRWDLMYFIFGFFLSFIPIVGLGIPLVFGVLQAYYIGNILLLLMYRTKFIHKMSIPEIKKISTQITGLSLGIGLGFTTLQFIPIIGMYLAPIYTLTVGNIILNKEINNSRYG
ncbi:MAG: hypothetical protein ACRC0A_00285 [Chitinophagaceae bacterium]